MEDKLRLYIRRITRGSILQLILGVFIIYLEAGATMKHFVFPFCIIAAGLINLLGGILLRANLGKRTITSESEVDELINKFPSNAWIATFIIIVVGFGVLDELYRLPNTSYYGLICLTLFIIISRCVKIINLNKVLRN